jgi:uncharacterized membrane protein YGL010W
MLAGALSGAELTTALLAVTLPILTALLARSPLNLLASGLLVLLALVLARESEPSLALAFYVTSWVVALHGFTEARRRKTVRDIEQSLSVLHGEMSAFLTALDRRSQTVDEARMRLVEPSIDREKA